MPCTCPAEEEWRPCPGSPAYEVSSHGRVRSIRTGRFLKAHAGAGRNGRYLKLSLGRARQALVHRLVCEAFHGPPPTPGAHADHEDFDPSHNHPGNLRWLAPALNAGRHLHRVRGAWEYVAEEEPPADWSDPDPAERVALERALERNGW